MGVFQTAELNALTDVQGERVGHTTLIKGDDIRTGVTAIIPASGYRVIDWRNVEGINLYPLDWPTTIMMGLARTCSFASNGSGDYVIAFSTHPNTRKPRVSEVSVSVQVVVN